MFVGAVLTCAVVYALVGRGSSGMHPVTLAAAGPEAVNAISGRNATEATKVHPLVDIAFIGDTYAAGTPVGGMGSKNWTALVDEQLDRTTYLIHSHVDANPGAGYVTDGAAGTTLVDQIDDVVSPDTTIVVLYGGIADVQAGASAADVTGAGTAALARISAIAPSARVLMVGASWTGSSRCTAKAPGTGRRIRSAP